MTTPHVLNELSHREVLTFLHDIDTSSYKEVVRNPDGTVQKVIIWTSSGKTQKIRETTITRNPNGSVATVTKTQYDLGGVVAATLSLTLARDGSNRISTATTTRGP